jgi:hypothetical protein
MRISVLRGLAFLICLVCLLGVSPVGGSVAQAASDSWSSTKKKKHHHKKKHKTRSVPATGSMPGTKAAPADDKDDDDTGGEEAEDDSADKDEKGEKGDDAKERPSKAKSDKKTAKADGEEHEGEDASGEGDDNGDAPVVRRKAHRVTDDGSGGPAPLAFVLSAGPRVVHRTFDFHDPLTNYNPGATKPYSYSLPAGPAPFVDLALYPGAFAGRGIASQIGLVGRYEKLIGTKTNFDQGVSLSTFGQEFEVGLRGRLPLDANELGVTAAYGKHSFHVTDTDPGPTASAVVPNVDYTFVRLALDGRLDLGAVAFGARVGTRLVTSTGALGETWFPKTKTNSIEAGVEGAFKLTPVFSIVAGVDFLRYAFNFNPVPTSNAVVAGGAVDQYISGYLALRVSISGG